MTAVGVCHPEMCKLKRNYASAPKKRTACCSKTGRVTVVENGRLLLPEYSAGPGPDATLGRHIVSPDRQVDAPY